MNWAILSNLAKTLLHLFTFFFIAGIDWCNETFLHTVEMLAKHSKPVKYNTNYEKINGSKQKQKLHIANAKPSSLLHNVAFI